MSGVGACPKNLVEAYGKDPSHVATSMDKPTERRKGAKKSKQRVSDEEHLISMLERLSLELSTSRGTRIGRCPFCNCCKKYVARQRSKSKEKVGSKGRSKSCGGLVTDRERELPVDRPKIRDSEPLPSKVPKPGKEKRSGADGQKPLGRPRLRRRGLGGLEDKTPSPRPPRARSAGRAPMINTAPQLSVEARSRRRATSASRLSAQRAPVRASSESRLRGPSAAEGLADSVRGSKGRRAPRNLLAELYRPDQDSREMQRRRGINAQQEPSTLPGGPAARAPRFGYQEAAQFWEPVAAEPTTQGAARFNGGFAPPPRIHVPTLQTAGNRSPARVHQADLDAHLQPERRDFDGASPGEIIYGPCESPGQLDPNCRGCGSSYTEDSIFCRHCGSKRAQTRTGHLEASPKAEDLDLDNATRQLEQLVEETHRALRAGTHNQDASLSEGPQAAPSLDAVDRALEELQRGLLEIDTVLAKPIPEASP